MQNAIKHPIIDPFTNRTLVACVLACFLYCMDFGSDVAVAVLLKAVSERRTCR